MPAPPPRRFEVPDQIIVHPRFRAEVVESGGTTLSRVVQEPGWRWSEHIRPSVRSRWCESHHHGVVLAGSLAVEYPDGAVHIYRAGDIIEVSASHDSWTVGDEPAITIEWTDHRTGVGYRLGDVTWELRAIVAVDPGPDATARSCVTETLVTRGGDLWTSATGASGAGFDDPAAALDAARAIRHACGPGVRLAVHRGEVAVDGGVVMGPVVGTAEAMLAVAEPGELLVTDVIRASTDDRGGFSDRGVHRFPEIDGSWRLHRWDP